MRVRKCVGFIALEGPFVPAPVGVGGTKSRLSMSRPRFGLSTRWEFNEIVQQCQHGHENVGLSVCIDVNKIKVDKRVQKMLVTIFFDTHILWHCCCGIVAVALRHWLLRRCRGR